jgi:hypothetical protein
MGRTVSEMERLTIKRRLPEKGLFMEVSKNEVRQIDDVSPDDVYRRLQAYEDTGLTPEEVETLKAFKAYFDDMYGKGLEVANWHMNGNLEPFDNFYEKASNAAKIRCKDCDYLNMDDGKPYCCHARMSTNGLDDWCYYGVKRKENNNA